MLKGSLFEQETKNFIENIIVDDLTNGKYQKIITRFPPEPNGYLHLGHCKALMLNFGLPLKIDGAICHLRFDDTNPEKEEQHYVDAIKADLKWLGINFSDHLYFTSDYYDKLYDFAVELIKKGLAYVDSQSAEEVNNSRGSLTVPGVNSPYRERMIEENLALFEEMKAGKFANGEHILRAKIDMSAPNVNMRDPALYRIKHTNHHKTGAKWCLYPMYDFAHALSDAIENITHSLCTLEFEDHRPLYNWFINHVNVEGKPRQIEFARLNIGHTVMSKRKLIQLVEEKHVEGWDDPRMPTITGMKRRGIPAKALWNFCEYISVGKKETIIDSGILDGHVRAVLNETTKRVMGVLEPLKVTITNWDEAAYEGGVQEIDAPFHPFDEGLGERKVHFGRELYIESSDFLENPPSPKKWFRLGPGRSVRLRYGPMITCDEFVKDEQTGNIVELKCRYIENSFAGLTPEGVKKAKGIIHWLNAKDACDAPVRIYEPLFDIEDPLADANEDFTNLINKNSKKVLNAKIEPYLVKKCMPGDQYQFERMGYFVADEVESKEGKPVFNRTVTLKGNYSK